MFKNKIIAIMLVGAIFFGTSAPAFAESMYENDIVENPDEFQGENVLVEENYNSDLVEPNLWPGRPGGNGDGSEEFLQGSYGCMNGPYRYIGSTSGRVSDLNRSQSQTVGILVTITGIPLSKLWSIAYGVASSIFLAGDRYEGITYRAEYYVSGRRLKVLIKTYSDDRMTRLYKTYTDIRKW